MNSFASPADAADGVDVCPVKRGVVRGCARPSAAIAAATPSGVVARDVSVPAWHSATVASSTAPCADVVADGYPMQFVSVPLLGVLGFYGLVQFVWLNFADHAHLWLPYRFYPLEASF